MQIVTINRKKLGITIILIGIMILILGFAKGFESRLKFTSLIQNDVNSLSEYTELNGRIKYKLPSEWQVRKQNMFGDEILCHTDFESKDDKIRGFFQVWKLNGDLKTFLKNSKIISDKQNLYKYYSLKNIDLDKRKGYLLKYDITKSVGGSYIGEEYFIKNGDEFYRFSFFVKEEDFKENMSDIFKTVVKTLKYN
ncbi:PsbP-related protein [Clostridium sp. LBM24168]